MDITSLPGTPAMTQATRKPAPRYFFVAGVPGIDPWGSPVTA